MKNENMQRARLKKNVTQAQLAKQVGASRQTICMIESGRFNPSLNLCRAICQALDCTLDQLFWE